MANSELVEIRQKGRKTFAKGPLLLILFGVLLLGVIVTISMTLTEDRISMRITVWDDTKQSPLGNRAEVWVRGIGSWWLYSKVTKFGSDFRDTPPQNVGYQDYVAVYADGRKAGQEIQVPYKITSEMVSISARDMLEISITDDSVVARGIGYRNVSGQYKRSWPRFP